MTIPEKVLIALDVGGRSVKSARVASGTNVIGRLREDAIASEGPAAEILKTLAAIITGHLDEVGDLLGIAVAFPGPFDYEQGICLIQDQAKFRALYGLDLGAKLRALLDMPGLAIRYRNDAEAAIVGEALHGAGAHYPRLLGLTLGTGLGSTFLVDGRLVTEGAGVPEHGWLYSLPHDGQRADDVFSTRGLLARLREQSIHATDVASAITSAREDSPALTEAFASFGEDLGRFLQPFVASFRPDGVLVSGGISEAWERFSPSLQRALSVPVVRGSLGKRAALLGGAALYF